MQVLTEAKLESEVTSLEKSARCALEISKDKEVIIS